MKRYRWQLLAGALALAACFAAADIPSTGVGVRWDILSRTSFNPPNILPGGHASALAHDGSMITLTGSGTFDLQEPDAVTGGGNWTTFDPKGKEIGKGAYQVTGLIRFNEGPGTQPAATVDNIGRKEDFRAGLAFLRIAYSDGSRGVLVIMCHTPTSPPEFTEGISSSKGALNYWNTQEDKPNVDGNRTTFHLIPIAR